MFYIRHLEDYQDNETDINFNKTLVTSKGAAITLPSESLEQEPS